MKKNLLTALFIIVCFHSNVQAEKIINITGGTSDPIPLAINDFAGVDPADYQLAKKIVAVISNDLRWSGMFRPISKAAFIENKIGTAHTPLFAAWQQINASLLVNGDVSRLASGKLQVKFTLWDTILERAIISEAFELSEKLWRRVAHKISDKV